MEVLVIVNHLSGKNVSQFELLACSNGQQDLLACVICSSQNQVDQSDWFVLQVIPFLFYQKLQLLTLPKLSVVYSVSVNDQIILSNGFIHEVSGLAACIAHVYSIHVLTVYCLDTVKIETD